LTRGFDESGEHIHMLDRQLPAVQQIRRDAAAPPTELAQLMATTRAM
jgi:hypothetical protein